MQVRVGPRRFYSCVSTLPTCIRCANIPSYVCVCVCNLGQMTPHLNILLGSLNGREWLCARVLFTRSRVHIHV